MSARMPGTAAIGEKRHARRAVWVALGALAAATLALLLLFLDNRASGGQASSGRMVDAGPASALTGRQPKAFPGDGFYLIRLDDGSLAALYVYPPGYFGHAQGCHIRWDVAPDLNSTFNQKDMWMEGCGGSLWDPSGHRLFGPTPRDLDRFAVSIRDGRLLVDTRRLICTADPCGRVPAIPKEFDLKLTDKGFKPARIEVPAGKPGYVVLENATDAPQNWHVIGAENTSPYSSIPSAMEPAPPFARGSDVHTRVVGAFDGPIGVPFVITRRGTYTFVSDADPEHLRGTLVVR
jgi:hypothetical protein